MLYDKIIFNNVEVNVVDYFQSQTYCNNVFDSSKNSTTDHLSFVTDNKEWFDTLSEGCTYPISKQGITTQWLLTGKNETEKLELEFIRSTPTS